MSSRARARRSDSTSSRASLGPGAGDKYEPEGPRRSYGCRGVSITEEGVDEETGAAHEAAANSAAARM